MTGLRVRQIKLIPNNKNIMLYISLCKGMVLYIGKKKLFKMLNT